MTIRKVFLFAGALVALSGCAAMNVAQTDPSPSVRNAVYVPNSPNSVVAQTKTADVAAAAADRLTPGQSPPMRIYWFLGGR